MKKVDYIIVGLGIAGISFAEQLRRHNHSFIVLDGTLKGATRASGGVLNPTVLKRFTAAWNIHLFSPYAQEFYTSLFQNLHLSSYKPIGIKRILHSVEEQNDWCVASDKQELSSYLSPKIETNTYNFIRAPFGFGNVAEAASMNTSALIDSYKDFLIENNQFDFEAFDYEILHLGASTIAYKSIQASKIVFCEGSTVVSNPFFPLSVSPEGSKVFVPNKGEYIIIKAPQLQIDFILKGPMMLIPLGDDFYKVGASYGRDETEASITNEATDYIAEKLKKMISCPFEIVDQVAGIRPTVKDRKPLLGKHPKHKNMYFFNGLGTRGLTMGPLLSNQLYNFISEEKELPDEVNLKRFLL